MCVCICVVLEGRVWNSTARKSRLDHLRVVFQVQVDYNKRCRIFIAPVESSIFIRNCEDCKCIFACQQLRTRECKVRKPRPAIRRCRAASYDSFRELARGWLCVRANLTAAELRLSPLRVYGSRD